MHTNIIACLLAAGFVGCVTTVDLRTGVPSQEEFSHENEVPTNDQVGGLDPYKVAVSFSVVAAILSLII
jgi:hypothetical protein